MDAHTLELLEFDKVRELLAGYAACSLGKDLARQVEPRGRRWTKVRAELALVTEMVEALGQGQAPPFGGLHDVRLTRPPGRHRRHADGRATPRSRRHAHLHRPRLPLPDAARRPATPD